MSDKKSESASRVTEQDVIDLLQLTALEIDSHEARTDSTHPGRQKFVREVVATMQNYFLANGIIKPEGYFQELQRTLSSRTTETIAMLEAAQKGDVVAFNNVFTRLDEAILRRMGQRPAEEKVQDSPVRGTSYAGQDVVPRVMRGPRSVFERLLEESTTIGRIDSDDSRGRRVTGTRGHKRR